MQVSHVTTDGKDHYGDDGDDKDVSGVVAGCNGGFCFSAPGTGPDHTLFTTHRSKRK